MQALATDAAISYLEEKLPPAGPPRRFHGRDTATRDFSVGWYLDGWRGRCDMLHTVALEGGDGGDLGLGGGRKDGRGGDVDLGEERDAGWKMIFGRGRGRGGKLVLFNFQLAGQFGG